VSLDFDRAHIGKPLSTVNSTPFFDVFEGPGRGRLDRGFSSSLHTFRVLFAHQ
jgi:hypothetical protein